MAREFARSRRVEEQTARILSDAIRQELGDPRVRGVVITSAQVARDLAVARIYYTVLGGEGPSPDAQAGLERAAGFLRSRLARELATRTVPELQFHYDETGDRARRLDALIDQAVGQGGGEPAASEDGPGGTGRDEDQQ